VAHRLKTIRNFDRIAVFENGGVAEYGEPEKLLADEGSRFKALWDSWTLREILPKIKLHLLGDRVWL